MEKLIKKIENLGRSNIGAREVHIIRKMVEGVPFTKIGKELDISAARVSGVINTALLTLFVVIPNCTPSKIKKLIDCYPATRVERQESKYGFYSAQVLYDGEDWEDYD